MPTIGVHVSDDLAEKIKAHANQHYRGKVSAYVGDLIDKDLGVKETTSGEIKNEQPITSLIEIYYRYLLPQFNDAIHRKENTPPETIILRSLLEQLMPVLRSGDVRDFISLSRETFRKEVKYIYEYSEGDEETMEARKILPPGVSLIDAARFYSQHHPGELFLVRDAVARFVSTKQKLSRRPTGKPTPHVSDLRKRLNSFALSFGDHPITSLTGEMILDWLNSLNQAPRSVQNYRVALNNLFNFSVRRKWLARSPLDTIAKEDLPAVRAPKKHPLQQWEVDALFNYARENTPRYLTYWALRFYIGVRAAEAERFRWEWIQRDLKRIVIPGWFYGHDDPDQIEQGTKTGDDWAIHDAPPIFWEIYDAAETFKKGQIPAPYPEVWRSKIRPAWLKATGHKQWPNNAPRDTFCTMHISAYMDPQRTALILKHTNSQTLHRSYLGTLVSEAEGKAYLGDTSGNDK